MSEKQTYLYKGPIMQFGSVKEEHWERGTTAVSFIQARKNLMYRAKEHLGLEKTAAVELDDSKIVLDTKRP